MPVRGYTRPWRQQPQGAETLSVAAVEAKARLFWSAPTGGDYVAGSLPNTDNTSRVAAEAGLAAQCLSGQTNVEWNRAFITTSDGAGTGDFAVMVVANPATTAATTQHMVAQKNDAGGTPFSQCGIFAHANSQGGHLPGSVVFFTFSGTDSGVASASAADGLMHVWFGVRRGSVHELWRDGVLLASATLAVRNIVQADRRTAIGSRGNGTTESFDQQAVYAAAFDSAPSAEFISELKTARDVPAIMLAPRRIFVPTAAAGGGAFPTLSLSTFKPGTLTSSGWTARVTAT